MSGFLRVEPHQSRAPLSEIAGSVGVFVAQNPETLEKPQQLIRIEDHAAPIEEFWVASRWKASTMTQPPGFRDSNSFGSKPRIPT
jgi:hypothetical protein